MNASNKRRLLLTSTLAVMTAAAAVQAAPGGDEPPDLPYDAIDLTEEEKWNLFEHMGPKYELTLADALEGEGQDPYDDIEPTQARVRVDLELARQPSTVVITDLDAVEGEAEAIDEGRSTLEKLIEATIALLIAFGDIDENAHNFALNGTYDGVLRSENGSTTDAVMRFTHSGNQIYGTLVVTDDDMTIDAGCTVMEVPISMYDFDASRVTAGSGYLVEAEGSINRSLRIGYLIGSVDVDLTMDMNFALRDDFDTLEADFQISPDFPCSDTMASGFFIRRPGTSPLP